MRRILAVCSINFLLWVPVSQADPDDKPTQKKDVSVFQVGWQCPAAPAIGCGSHAKPVLLKLQADPSVREAWLNRQGTMVAVVWNPDAKKKARRQVKKTLKEQNAARVSGDKE